MNPEESLAPIVHKILFNCEEEKIPDPNKPENLPRLKAMRQAKVDSFKKFWEGQGSVLMDRWQNKIRDEIFVLLTDYYTECTCKTCVKIRETVTLVRLLSEAQLILSED